MLNIFPFLPGWISIYALTEQRQLLTSTCLSTTHYGIATTLPRLLAFFFQKSQKLDKYKLNLPGIKLELPSHSCCFLLPQSGSPSKITKTWCSVFSLSILLLTSSLDRRFELVPTTQSPHLEAAAAEVIVE